MTESDKMEARSISSIFNRFEVTGIVDANLVISEITYREA